jgi:hypothetical protein
MKPRQWSLFEAIDDLACLETISIACMTFKGYFVE